MAAPCRNDTTAATRPDAGPKGPPAAFGRLPAPLVLLLCLAALAPAVEAGSSPPAPEPAAVYAAECSACHGERGDGAGPAARFLKVKPRDFTARRFKLKSTPGGQAPSRSDLLRTVAHGIRASGMPAFDFLSQSELAATVTRVLQLAGLAGAAPPAVLTTSPAAPASAPIVERGRSVYESAQCSRCHLPAAGPAPPVTLLDDAGQPVRAPDLAHDELLGRDSPLDLFWRVSAGMDGTPMPSFEGALSHEDRWALAHHLRSIRRPRREERRFSDVRTQGAILVARFRCDGCHVIRGSGGEVGPSLDLSGRKLQAGWIRAWLSEPRPYGKVHNERPYRMPDLKLAPRDVEDLVGFVLSLGGRRADDPVESVPAPDPREVAEGASIYARSCTRCHALGTVVPSAVAAPNGPDLIRIAQRADHGWLLGSIVSEGLPPDLAAKVRSYLWQASSRAAALAGAPGSR
jgi:cytochrome c oxidase cbb3-type subunit 2